MHAEAIVPEIIHSYNFAGLFFYLRSLIRNFLQTCEGDNFVVIVFGEVIEEQL